MSKAKPIDRLALTRAKFGAKMYGDERPKPEVEINDTVLDAGQLQEEKPYEVRTATTEHWGLSECPMCKRLTLKHEGGCVQCTSCGWSACG